MKSCAGVAFSLRFAGRRLRVIVGDIGDQSQRSRAVDIEAVVTPGPFPRSATYLI